MFQRIVLVSCWFLSSFVASQQIAEAGQDVVETVDHSKNVLNNAFLALNGAKAPLVGLKGVEVDGRRQVVATLPHVHEGVIHSPDEEEHTFHEMLLNLQQELTKRKHLPKDVFPGSAMSTSSSSLRQKVAGGDRRAVFEKFGGKDDIIELAEWVSAFGNMDADDNGSVDAREFGYWMLNAGYTATDTVVLAALFKVFSNEPVEDLKDGDGTITLAEWIEEFGHADCVAADKQEGAGVLDAAEFCCWLTVHAEQGEEKTDSCGGTSDATCKGCEAEGGRVAA